MYKHVSIVLFVCLVIASIAYGHQSWKHAKDKTKFNNQMAKIHTMRKETESVYSQLGMNYEGLEAENKDLSGIIDDRDEKILALADANLKLKNKTFKIKSAKETLVNPIIITESCQEETKDVRYKVEFDEKGDLIRISGYTLTNPAYAEVKLDWIRDLNMQLVLTKDNEDRYRIYVDSASSDVVPTKLALQVDPSVFDLKWYQKIGIGADLAAGHVSIRAFYDIFPNLYIGPYVAATSEYKIKMLYGITVGYYPWR